MELHKFTIPEDMTKDELYHYGIKGMKWGVRRYQNSNGTLTAKGKERYLRTKMGMSQYAGMKPRDDDGNEVSRFSEYGEDWIQERVSGPDGLMYPVHSKIRSERYRQDYVNDPDSVFEKHMSKINTTNGDETGTVNNCTKVASSMILAKMGYDYDAGRSMSGQNGAFKYWFDNVESTICDDLSSAIDQKFSKTSDNSYGTVGLLNKNGGGHVFNWERNSKGDFNLYEAQVKSGEKFSGASPKECFDKYIKKYPWFSSESSVFIHDMTSATPNWDHMAEDSVVRITDGSYESRLYDTSTRNIYKSF